ncbi:long-chain fatty acid--CoA ligase [Paralimibaculum aggregatum]|uniref:Long-chain fatty acid--CoA ligase n=1 Tax=Paralimibaculum aggregatum TaxID=3036245 RepID=A0ABQ6LR90_9RHOB|nr:AMP-binding protein [Limibaculum sp. NKW23]GMG83485.1 long-chain fatty acid--CoA ligase [Limibaculum sp. NKW23]
MNPAEWLARAARRWPGAPALLTDTTLEADYAGFARRAAAIGQGLAARHGIRPGDRVAIFMKNRPAYLEALYGAWFAGAAAVPINAKLHPREAAWIVENAGARLAFASADPGDGLAAVAPGCLEEIVMAGSPAYEALAGGDPLHAPHPMAPGDMAWLFYTSGTTGKPKGVMITAANLQAMALSYFANVDAVHQSDAALYAAPISHGAGLYNFMHVLRGARHAVPGSGGFEADEILALAPRLGDVSMFAAPTMVRRLVDRARAAGAGGEGIRTVVYGGGPMYLADIVEAVAVMGPRFVQIYGQGESPMTITALARELVADRSHPRWRERLASVGLAQACVSVRVADAEGRALPAGETGEILVRGATVMPGYWRNPEASAATLKGGWLWTGDMGRLDADGFLTLQDRSKDVIISGGTNIYPREIEEVLLTHPDVAEAAAVGRRHADWGEEVVAFVAPAPGREIDPAALDRLCLEQIARFKRPKDYRVLPALPKNNYGKVLKTELRRRLDEEEG